ncbi:putative ATPase/DNA-binding winged helix-turn-helix (wHTH) protein [Bradyrhizobium yuanmingense]
MTTPTGPRLSFGPFTVAPHERLVTRDGVTVPLGAKAFDALTALMSRPNEVVSKWDLMALVWPGITVEEANLRFHIAALRKALGDGKDGARYITTLSGRGYCFVAPISHTQLPAARRSSPPMELPPVKLPNRLQRMIGRDQAVTTISDKLLTSRFVTIVGPGGVGKTAVAVAIAHDLLATFSDAAHFVDLAALSDPNLVITSILLMLGLPAETDDPLPALLAHVRDKRLLLILDNCEHVIAAAAPLASAIFHAAPDVHILATSREALRVEGEQVYRLAPLAVPPDSAGLSAAAAQTYPALQLFIERATAGGAQIALDDTNAATIARICRNLDGMALAIELAAGRVEAYGLEQTAALLDERLNLLWQGQRTAPPRQKTLRATLDWSYGLLSDIERLVLRRLAVFAGHFTIDAALEVVPDERADRSRLFDAIDSLVAKFDGRAAAGRRHDALPSARYHARLSARDRAERCRARRPPRDLLPAMAGAGRQHMGGNAERRRTGDPLLRAPQCACRAGLVLWRGRRRHRRHCARRRGSADLPRDVPLDRMPALVGTGTACDDPVRARQRR